MHNTTLSTHTMTLRSHDRVLRSGKRTSFNFSSDQPSSTKRPKSGSHSNSSSSSPAEYYFASTSSSASTQSASSSSLFSSTNPFGYGKCGQPLPNPSAFDQHLTEQQMRVNGDLFNCGYGLGRRGSLLF